MSRILVFLGLVGFALALPLLEISLNLTEESDTGNVKFYLYTKRNPSTPQQLYIGNVDSVNSSNYGKALYTKIIIHGWGGSYTTSPNVALREAYLSKNDFNIISVDWNEYSKLDYLSARDKVPIVGKDVAEFIDFLNEKFGLNFDKLVVIGHSLGAHVAGFAGKLVKRGKIEGIAALDPASPLYNYGDPSTRLASTDAKYVQSIQTNGNLKGFLWPIGSATFYPNWGRSQPGCGLDVDGVCAHARSVDYYAEALRGYSFEPVYECENIGLILDESDCSTTSIQAEIGDPLEIPRVNGIFYFKTNDEAPFGHKKNSTSN